MVDGGEAAVGNDIERLLAAVIGMRPPADIGQQAGSVTKPAFLGRFTEAGGGHEAVGPCDQLFAVARRARTQFVEPACRFDQRILLLGLLLEQRIEQALAHAECGEYHLARLADAHDVFQHQRRIGQQRPPCTRHYFDIGERLGIDPMHQAGEFERVIGGNGVAVHHVQRVSGLPHVQPRQRPPGAADGVEVAALAVAEQRQGAEGFLDELFRLLERFRRNVGQGQTAERPGQAASARACRGHRRVRASRRRGRRPRRPPDARRK